jgi:hypothetical protein
MGGKIDILEEYVTGEEIARLNGRGQSIRTHGVFPFSKLHCRVRLQRKTAQLMHIPASLEKTDIQTLN